ncbi:MAG: addiction module protein [Rubrivivax sp.]|nr:addiction module protein [Rubrivivax sp.]
MGAHFDRLLSMALRLSVDERAAMAAALLDSLEDGADASMPEAWRAELRCRRAQLQAGETSAVPWEDARARLSAM